MTLLPEHYLKVGNPETLAEELRKFARHEHHLVRLKVAEHLNSPHDVLKHLADDEHVEIRIAVSDHPGAPEALLEQLSNDANPDVRYALAENPNVPIHLLRRLADDENAYVSCRAQKTIKRVQLASETSIEPKPNGSQKTG